MNERLQLPEKTSKLILIGDSAFAEVAYEYFTCDSPYEVVAFCVERAYLQRETLLGLPIVALEDLEKNYPPEHHDVFAAITYQQLNRLRFRLAESAKAKGYRLASYVSSNAFVWRNVQVGEHCFIFEDNTIQPFVSIGNNVVIWSGNHIGHHSTICDNCFVSSHVAIAGNTEIGANSFLGVNATISNDIKVGADNWVGPNVAVMKPTSDGVFFKTAQPTPAERSSYEFFKVSND